MSNLVAGSLELFHLELLRNLRPRAGRFEYALKGGTNLRFFHGSVRYSQDADLDILRGTADQVQAEVRRALDARALHQTLAAHGIEMVDQSMAKQTDTTQRWKLRLLVQLGTRSGGRLPIPTRIEFSAREELLDYLGETREDFVAERVAGPHRVLAPLLPHYLAAPATIQKVRSLAERQQVQARDVFDLELLFRTNPGLRLAGRIDPATTRQAIERAAVLTFEAYQAQVVAFLEEEYAAHYDNPRQWDHVRLSVIDALEALLA